MIEKLMENPYAWLFLSALTIFFGLFSIYTWIKSKKKKEISYRDTSYIVVKTGKNNISKMSILYDNIDVPDISITKYAIWNSGNQILREDDIVSPQLIEVLSENECKILDAQIIGETDESNKFISHLKGHEKATICFDYIAPNDGCVLQLLHTGNCSDIAISCKIKGGKKLKHINEEQKSNVFLKFVNPKTFMAIYIIVLTILMNLISITGLLANFIPTLYKFFTQPEIVFKSLKQ